CVHRPRLDVDAACVRRSTSPAITPLSRRLDPLDRTRANPKLCGNLQDTLVALRQGLPDACLGAGVDLGPTKGLAIGPRPLEARVDAADNHGPFELSEDTQHLEHRLARWSGRVDALLMQVQINPRCMDLPQESHKVL